METYSVNWNLDSSLANYKLRITDCYEKTLIDKLDECDNLTFLGWADANSNYREAIFQIKDYETVYLRICKDTGGGSLGVVAGPYIRLSTTASLSTVNSYLNVQYGGTSGTLLSSNILNAQFDFWMITKDKENNKKDLQVFWQCKAPGQSHTGSQGFILGTSANNRDYIGIIGSGNNNIFIYYLDDSTLAQYSIPSDTTGFSDEYKIFKMNWMPITVNGNIANTRDNCENYFVKIFNSNAELNAIEVATSSNKDSSSIRKLIQVGDKKYRQIVTCYWVEDPKGDEPTITLTNIT